MKLLPAVLSMTAGRVGVISFLRLGGLFTAHNTGNLAILAARKPASPPFVRRLAPGGFQMLDHLGARADLLL
jgi:hypothetical protein